MTRPAITVRRATRGDVPAMGKLWTEYMAVHREHDRNYAFVRDARAIWARWVRSHFDSPDSLVLVAEGEGRMAGFCHAEIARRPPVMRQKVYGTIMDFAVTRTFRRLGVGTALLRECRRWFAARRVRRIEIRVLMSNPLAVSFWKRMGFRPYLAVQYLSL